MVWQKCVFIIIFPPFRSLVGSNMKRTCDGQMRAAIIRLNVGGRYFDTTKETLSMSSFFDALLGGRMGHSVDDQGRLFIDRSPDLFMHILQFMRTTQCPNQQFVRKHKQALLEECDYFGLDWMTHKIRGEISPYDLRLADRELRDKEKQADPNDYQLIDLFKVDTSPLDPLKLILPILPESKAKRATIKGGLEDFLSSFDQITCGLRTLLQGVKGIAFAGGSVCGALTDTQVGDVDIFLLCTIEEAEAKLRLIFEAVQQVHKERYCQSTSILVTRSKYAVTIFTVHRDHIGGIPVQVILSIYPSVSALLLGFDVDCCACAYIPEGKQGRVVCTERCLRALRFGANVADTRFDGPNYCQRLSKYDARGFAIAVPGFEQTRVATRIHRASYIYLQKHDLLLRAQPPQIMGKELSLTKGQDTDIKAIQKCSAVRGFERLAVFKLCANIRETLPAHPSPHKADKNLGECLPLFMDDGIITLLWGMDQAESDDDEQYTSTPLSSARALIEKRFKQQQEQKDELDWWEGGAMKRVGQPVTKSLLASKRHVQGHRMLFVYDFGDRSTMFEKLHFVIDAGREPLKDFDDETFENTYGLARRLQFKKAEPRRHVPSDWWSSVYE